MSTTVATITSPANTDDALFTNTGDGVNVVYQQIVATGYRLGFILVPENERTADQKNCQKSRRRTIRKLSRKFRRAEKIKIWCNATMDCVNNNAQCNRTLTGWQDLLHYHTTLLGLTWTNSLPVLCPPRKQLEELLKHSLEFEERIMPDFFCHPARERHTLAIVLEGMARRKKNVLLGRPRATISKRSVLGRNRPGTNGEL